MNESYYSFVPPHLLHRTPFIRATPCHLHMNESYRIYERIILFICGTSFVAPYVIHTCHSMSFAYKWVISHIWMRHIAYMDEAYYSFEAPLLCHRTLFMCATPCHLHINESYRVYEWIIFFICATSFVAPHVIHTCHPMSFTYKWVISLIWMRDTAYVNESCYSFVAHHLCHSKLFMGATPCHLHMNESYCIYEWVVLLICASSFAPP